MKTYFQKRKNKITFTVIWFIFMGVIYYFPIIGLSILGLMWVFWFHDIEQPRFEINLTNLKDRLNAENEDQVIIFCSTVAKEILTETDLGAECILRYPGGNEKTLVGGEYSK